MKDQLKPADGISISDLQNDLQKFKSIFLASNHSKNGTEHNNDLNFKPEIFQNLPGILNLGCDKLIDHADKQVFLLGALGVISGMLPNINGLYDISYYSPNLFVHLLGKYGMGKGSLSLARRICIPVHKAKRQAYDDAFAEYKKEFLRYRKDLKTYQNDKKGIIAEPLEPEPPPQTMLFIPANNSKSGLFELLDENNGCGILFETEGDALVDAIKQDYGNYSYGLRQAFQHEPISFYRRQAKEHREIDSPKLSVVLSSTWDQLQHLIPDINNGLYSRFIYYELQPDRKFKNVFDKSKRDYLEFFDSLGVQMKQYYDYLSALESPVIFHLTEDQELHFLSLFAAWKQEFGEYVTTDLDGTVHRLALICFRIAMLLTTLRALDENELYTEVYCSEIDFQIALSITDTLKANSLNIYYRFPDSNRIVPVNKFDEKALKISRAMELKKQGWSYQKIADELEEPKTTVYRWLNSKI